MDEQQWNWFLTPSTTPTNPVFSPPSGSINTPGTSVGSHYQETFDTAPSQRSAPQRTLAPSPFPDCQSTSSYTQHDQTLAALTGEIPKPQTALDFAAQGFDAASFQSCSFSDRDSIIPGSLDPFQVQTPPPTRGPSAKRRSDWNQSSQSDTPSSMMHSFRASQPSSWQTNDLPASMSHPNLSFQMQGAVEQQRHDIGMSTDVAHMQPSQQPQQRRTNAHMQRHSLYARMPQQMYADSAGGHTASTHNTPAKNAMTSNLPAVQAMSASMHNMQAFAQYSNAFGVQNDMASFPDLQRGGPARASNPGVNPSLVYTSPGRFMSPTGSGGIQSSMLNTSWNNNVNAGTAPQSMSSAGQMQSDTLNIPIADPKTGKERSVRPGLQRSNTTGTSRTPSNYSSADSLRNVSSVAPPRRSSPLKSFVRSSLNSLSSISEAAKALPRSRTTVVLTIDSDGRARTETRSLTASPSKAMKTRYPTLWDGSDDDDDSDSGHSSRVPSRTDSISSSRPLSGLTRLPKLDTSIEDSQALRLPRSSSSASARQTPTKSSYATASHLRRQGSVKKPTHQTNRDKRSSMASLTGSFADLPLSFADERDRDATPSNAGAALRQAMEQRGAQQGSDMKPARVIARPRRQSQQASRPGLLPRTISLQNLGFNHTSMNIMPTSQPASFQQSPTKSVSISPMDPFASSAFNGAQNDAMAPFTRCICNVPLTDGQHMIQCSTCNFWLHSACVGMHPQQVPAQFICNFCCMSTENYMQNMNWDLTAAV